MPDSSNVANLPIPKASNQKIKERAHDARMRMLRETILVWGDLNDAPELTDADIDNIFTMFFTKACILHKKNIRDLADETGYSQGTVCLPYLIECLQPSPTRA